MSSDFKQKPLVRMVAFVMCLSNSFVASWRKGLLNEVLTKLIRIVWGFQGSYGWLHVFFFTMWNKIVFFQDYTSHRVLFFSFHYDNSLFARIVDNNCFNQAIFVKMSNLTMNTHLKPWFQINKNCIEPQWKLSKALEIKDNTFYLLNELPFNSGESQPALCWSK